MSVGATAGCVSIGAQFHACNVFQADYFSVCGGLDDHVLILLGFFEATTITEGVLERVVVAFADITRRRFDILFGEYTRNVCGH